MTEEATPNLKNFARLGRLNELISRLRKLKATGQAIKAVDATLIDELFTNAEQAGVVTILNKTRAAYDKLWTLMDSVGTK